MSDAEPSGSERRVGSIVAVASALLLLLASAESARAAGARSAKVCAACHSSIQKAWSASVKAKSWTNPVFQAGLREAREARGDSIALSCMACHAPQAAVTGDLNVQNPVSQEGITCSFCHNVGGVEVSSRPASYMHDASKPNLMRGPYRDADPGSAHESVYHEVFTKSDFCAACHWAVNDKGVPTQRTYPMWKASKAAVAGKQCQDCHMPPAPGKASPLSRKQRAAVYAHVFKGPRVPGGLDSVATITAAVQGGRLRLTVRNSRGGHALPGGAHGMRAITLEARFFNASGKELSRVPVATYTTEFADAAGTSPVPKWLAARTVRTREIPADSAVVEWAPVPAGATRAEGILTYEPFQASYRAHLEGGKVDLTGRDPVVLAKIEVPLP